MIHFHISILHFFDLCVCMCLSGFFVTKTALSRIVSWRLITNQNKILCKIVKIWKIHISYNFNVKLVLEKCFFIITASVNTRQSFNCGLTLKPNVNLWFGALSTKKSKNLLSLYQILTFHIYLCLNKALHTISWLIIVNISISPLGLV